jgi:hypothetical protein
LMKNNLKNETFSSTTTIWSRLTAWVCASHHLLLSILTNGI